MDLLFNLLAVSASANYMSNLQVLFCSTENGRSSFVRQLEPDWHIDSNPEIIFQLAVSDSCTIKSPECGCVPLSNICIGLFAC